MRLQPLRRSAIVERLESNRYGHHVFPRISLQSQWLEAPIVATCRPRHSLEEDEDPASADHEAIWVFSLCLGNTNDIHGYTYSTPYSIYARMGI